MVVIEAGREFINKPKTSPIRARKVLKGMGDVAVLEESVVITNVAKPRETAVERFQRVVQAMAKFGRVVIVVTQIDLDAIGAGLGMKYLLNWLTSRTQVIVAYAGAFAHPQNRAADSYFNLTSSGTFVSLDKLILTDDDVFVLADSSSFNDKRLLADSMAQIKIGCRVIVDHHRGFDIKATDEQFFWVEEVGAASTLVVELAQALVGEGNLEKIFDVDAMTALAAGIYNDTQSLI